MAGVDDADVGHCPGVEEGQHPWTYHMYAITDQYRTDRPLHGRHPTEGQDTGKGRHGAKHQELEISVPKQKQRMV